MHKKVVQKGKMPMKTFIQKASLGKKSGKSCGCGCTGRRKVK